MNPEIKRIEYRHGTLTIGLRPSELPMQVWSGSDLSSALLQSIQAQEILSLGGQYGKQVSGLPIQYDEIRLFTDANVVEIILYNRDNSLSFSRDEKMGRIARLLRTLSDPADG